MKVVKKVFVGVVCFILSVVLCLGVVYSCAVYSVREVYSEEFVYNLIEGVDFGALEFPADGGGTVTLAEMAGAGLNIGGVIIDEENLDYLVRFFSIDDVISAILQDWRGWLFDFRDIPVFDPYALADIIVSGMERDVYEYFAGFGDVRELFAAPVGAVLASVDSGEIAGVLEPVRVVISGGALWVGGSAVILMALVLLLVLGRRIWRWGCLIGVCGGVSGSAVLIGVLVIRENLGYIAAGMGVTKSMLELAAVPLVEFAGVLGVKLALASVVCVIIGGVGTVLRKKVWGKE